LALIPLTIVVGAAAVRSTAWFQAMQRTQWQQRISNNLGLQVQFDSISFPAPDRFRLKNLVCTHPETGKEIARVQKVDAWIDRTGWAVDLDSPEVNGEHISDATKVFHDWFLCRPKQTASLLKLNVSQLAIFHGSRPTRFQNVEVGLKPTEETSTLFLLFSMEGQPFTERASLIIERQHALSVPTTKCSFRTNDVAIPCYLLADRMPAFRHLGNQAHFQGKLDWQESNAMGVADIRGVFHSVDFFEATAPIGSPIRGPAKIILDRLVLSNERVQLALGTIESQEGNISVNKNWINQTVQRLSLPVATAPTSSFSELSAIRMKFQLTPQGLNLDGLLRRAQDTWPMIAMVNGVPIYGNQADKPISVATVRDWLQNQSVTLNDETIARHLPWPNAPVPIVAEQRVATDRR
jgi:hypothetical protein